MKIKCIVTITIYCCCFFCFSQNEVMLPNKEISHTFYATGNLATHTGNQENIVLSGMVKMLRNEKSNVSLLFLGNNASPLGFSKDNLAAKQKLDAIVAQIRPISQKNIFIPGTSDWKSGLQGLKDQEEYLQDVLGNKDVFLPENGCPLEKIKINNKIDLLILDSQWALSNWDKFSNINAACDIKIKEEFYVAIESEILKSQGKTVLIAVYHPIATYGKYGGNFSFGINPQNINNTYYKEFSERLLTIAQLSKNVVFISGHEHNLQYIVEKNIPVIISAAGGAVAKANKGINSRYRYNDSGFSKIVIYQDGSIWVSFYGVDNGFKAPLYIAEVIKPAPADNLPNYNEYNSPEYVSKAIYEPEELERSAFYKTLWGRHYRKDYQTPIKVKVALLDTLYGGLSPIRAGGGHQTTSLRLETKDGREFMMRSVKKSALRFIQYFIFKTKYLEPDIEDTFFIQLLQDYWTTANPYAPLTIGDLSDALGIYHANTAIFYVPKQKALGSYNNDYGDKIYFIEERITEGHNNVTSLGNADEIESTSDLLDKLRRKDKIKINESLYIRTRLFDNIIGDWDRHADQWRWAIKNQENGIDLYEPIPRDRDQAFSDFDGFTLGVLTTLNPPLRFMQRYDKTYNAVKWFNDAGDDVDMAVLMNHNQEDWLREARFIKQNLTGDIIEKAFTNIPKEMDQTKLAKIKQAMKGRLHHVEENALALYENLRSTVLVVGTDKDDWFVITRKPNGITNVTAYRIIKGEKETKFWDVDYDKSVTHELWIFGLDDADIFEVNGEGDAAIKIKIIGGRNSDIYRVSNKKNVRVFDHKSQPNTFENPVSKTFSDNYDLNTYYFKKNRRDVSQIIPVLGYDPDNGLGLGANYSYTKNSLWRNPFTQNHSFKAVYFMENSGVDVNYSGEFANLFDKVNLGIAARYSSPNYTYNFFGLGNETENLDDDLDFNRIRLRTLFFSPSLILRGYYGSTLKLAVSYENLEVERTQGRFIETAEVNPAVFEGQQFIGTEVSYDYKNFDNLSLPKKGIGLGLSAGYKTNLEDNRGYAYLVPEVQVTTKLDKTERLVYATKFKGHLNLGNGYEFYQAASIGDGDGLRGFRQQRFSGKYSYVQSSDLRLALGRIRNAIIPISYGAYGGFDYGRVWSPNDDSAKWHNSPGGGLYFNLAGFNTANLAYFTTDEGGRFTFALSFAF